MGGNEVGAGGLIPKSEFIGLENVTHLAAGGETPVLISNAAAVTRFMVDKGVGMPGRDRMFATATRARERLARLLSARSQEIALLWNATAGLHAVAVGIDWRPGDNVVVGASEFASLLHIWQAAGIELRRVGSGPCATLDEVADAVDSHTRAIVVSHVSYLTGARSDLAALREIADRYGARLVVDASHSLGVVPVDGSLCDVVVSCCYKWLLGTHGVGVFFVNSKRWHQLEPKAVGWNSVIHEADWRRRTSFHLKPTIQKFEGGNPSFMSIYYLENALATLEEIGISRIESHVLELGRALLDGLSRLGVDQLTPARPADRAGNISIATPHSEQLEARLRERGVLTWAGDGRLRISVHAYNDMADVDRVLEEIKELGLFS
ncbi:aminotransferase class V-fold PLP-dependent enzyme [Mesorhizobium sp. NZP2077]|uniref:aminotransferase class V-fold PLP-dependent enzyme n=1 Tax=Mesorhizobium sp. NZP2077 TaxID=2483404 RepID=UPI001555F291|nr:aminotransferase class V-fold PLP-dependent enzyme [Mesorhizobium sp. NZP2077]QKC86733.1 aminotransferase class V-fold PLP-dependent enzyme [Mesorhizobium sp. NZP2077]QKD20429.1 aminotransferase class V-fold PLP-dependent enzyme [Mesorhizobium sp. NZP2077]